MPTPIDYSLSVQANTAGLAQMTSATHAVTQAVEQLAGALGSVQTKSAAVGSGSGGGLLGQIVGGNLITAGITAVGRGLLDLGGAGLKATADLESTRIGFVTLMGSAQAADTELAKIRDLANRTPFSFDSLVAGERRFLNLGISADRARELLIATGNAAASTGTGSEGVDRITLALAQMGSKGKVSSEELNQISEVGVPALQMLAAGLNKSTGETQKLVEAGAITADTFYRIWNDQSASRFGNAMEAQSHTLSGLASTAGDLGQTLLTGFGTAAVSAMGLNEKAESLINYFSDPRVAATLKEWGTSLGTMVGYLAEGVGYAASFIGNLLGLPAPAAGLATGLQGAATAAGGLSTGLSAGLATTVDHSKAIADLESQIARARDTAATEEAAFAAQLAPLREKLRLQEQAWAVQKQQADLAALDADESKLERLRHDKYSSLGQRAQEKYEQDEAQKKQLRAQMEQGAIKNGMQNEISAIEARKQAAAAHASARERDLARQIRDLKDQEKAAKENADTIVRAQAAIQAAIGNVTKAIAPFGMAGAVTTATTGGLGAVGKATDDLKAKWLELTGEFDKGMQNTLGPLGLQLDKLVNQFIGRGGMAGAMAGAGFEMERLFRSIGALGAPTMEWFGHLLASTGMQAAQMAAGLRLVTAQASGDTAGIAAAHKDIDAASAAINAESVAWGKRSATLGGDHDAQIRQINADIDTRKAQALNNLDREQRGLKPVQGPLRPGDAPLEPASVAPGTVIDGRVVQGPVRPPVQGPVRPGQTLNPSPQGRILPAGSGSSLQGVTLQVVLDPTKVTQTVDARIIAPNNVTALTRHLARNLEAEMG